MNCKYLNFLSALVIFLLYFSSSFAQESFLERILEDDNLREELNSNFSEKFLSEISSDTNDEKKSTSSKLPEIQNTETLKADDQLISDKEEANTYSKISNVEQYYKLLISNDLPIFGQKSFSKSESKNSFFFNTIGRDYILAPGDVLKLSVRGLNEFDKEVEISQFGTITLPGLNPLNVNGLNIKEAEEKLLNLVKFDDSSASINISLAAARLIPIQITGAAKFPQTIAVPAYTPLSRILPKVGGIQADGSFRNISLTDVNNSKTIIDLYGLLRDNDNFNDPILKNASRIHINDIGLTVAVAGFVGRPGIFELPDKIKSIKASDLLELANAKMIPPGATLEILKLDSRGISKTDKIVDLKNQIIHAGEVLNVKLPQTTNSERISVEGAVLNSYEINTSTKKSLAEILKYGATLRTDAVLGFAIIKPKPTANKILRTVDLHYAFANPNKVLIAPGESVIILNARLYDLILDHMQEMEEEKFFNDTKVYSPPINEQKSQEDTNTKNSNSIVNKILQVLEFKELHRTTQKIYFDNNLIDLVPSISKNLTVKSLMEQIHLPRDLSLDFALKIENFSTPNRTIKSFSPKKAFNKDVYNNTFSNNGNPVNVKLFSNQYLRSILTFEKNKKSKDQAELSNKSIQLNKGNTTKKLSLNNVIRAEVEASQPVKLYIDGELIYLISKSTNFQESVAFDLLKNNIDLYPFIVRSTQIKKSNQKIFPSPHYSSFEHIIDKNISSIEFFTHSFVRKVFTNETFDITNIQSELLINKVGQSETGLNQAGLNQMGPNQMGPNQMGPNQMGPNQMGLNQMGLNQMGLNQAPLNNNLNSLNLEVQESKPVELEFEHLEAFKRNSKLISGALEKPGFYPIVGRVSLENLISLAGGLLPGADLANITIREYGNNQKGETYIKNTKYIDITSVDPKIIFLENRFTLYIPNLVNNADVGSIELKGEISHPGMYSFSREETLGQILERAGGFTKTAYPLGASFFRESLKTEQKITNQNLAREIEQSILFLSQSQLTGAGDQIKAVVAYANQLKNMPTTGRQNINIEGSSLSMFLQDGDTLFVPKRPAHVTVSGSVQNAVTAVYHPKKSLTDYISDAGGYKRIADKDNIFVLLPNGKNLTLSSLKKDGEIIPSGSVIVVPPKTDKLTALGLTDIWSRVLGNIATSILAINAATR